jgi:16S rRNA (guanine1207-N2)-methyltransferase
MRRKLRRGSHADMKRKLPIPAADLTEAPRLLIEEIAGQRLSIWTRSGFAEWWHVDPAQHLLAGHAQVLPGERVLVAPCGHGALAAWCARSIEYGQVVALDTDVVAGDMARLTLQANKLGHVRVVVCAPPVPGDPFDVALMAIPKGRDLCRLYLLSAYQMLAPGGRLYIAGANKGGIKSVIGDAEALYGPAVVLGYKAGNRVALLTRPEGDPPVLPPGFSRPGIPPGTYRTIHAEIHGQDYAYSTRPGVFSWKRLDAGTEMLLETVSVGARERILDLGCGYGAIGLFAASQFRNSWVDLVDADALATDCAERNRLALGAENAAVHLRDGRELQPREPYSLVVSNPPFHQGRAQSTAIAERFIALAHRVLGPSGRLALVANRFLPYERAMAAAFGHVDTLASSPHYRVLCSRRSR